MSWRHGRTTNSYKPSSAATSARRIDDSPRGSARGRPDNVSISQLSTTTGLSDYRASRSADSGPSWTKPFTSKLSENYTPRSAAAYRSSRDRFSTHRSPSYSSSAGRDVTSNLHGPLSPTTARSSFSRSNFPSAVHSRPYTSSSSYRPTSKPLSDASNRILSPPRATRSSTVTALAKAFEKKSESLSPLRSPSSRTFRGFSPSASSYGASARSGTTGYSRDVYSPTKNITRSRDLFSPTRERYLSPPGIRSSREPFSPSRYSSDVQSKRYEPAASITSGINGRPTVGRTTAASGRRDFSPPSRVSSKTSLFHSPTRSSNYGTAGQFATSFATARNSNFGSVYNRSSVGTANQNPRFPSSNHPSHSVSSKSYNDREPKLHQSSSNKSFSKATTILLEEANKEFNELANKISVELSSERESINTSKRTDPPASPKSRDHARQDHTDRPSPSRDRENKPTVQTVEHQDKKQPQHSVLSPPPAAKGVDSDGYDSSSSDGRTKSNLSPLSGRSEVRRKAKPKRVRQQGTANRESSLAKGTPKMSRRPGPSDHLEGSSSSDDPKEQGSYDARLRARSRRLQKSRKLLHGQNADARHSEPLPQSNKPQPGSKSLMMKVQPLNVTATVSMTSSPAPHTEDPQPSLGRTNPLTNKPSRFLKPKQPLQPINNAGQNNGPFAARIFEQITEESLDSAKGEPDPLLTEELLAISGLPIMEGQKSQAPQKLSLNYIEYWNEREQNRSRRGSNLVKQLVAAAESKDAGETVKSKSAPCRSVVREVDSTDRRHDADKRPASQQPSERRSGFTSESEHQKSPPIDIAARSSPDGDIGPSQQTEKVLLAALLEVEEQISTLPDKVDVNIPNSSKSSTIQQPSGLPTPARAPDESFLERCQRQKRQREEEAVKRSSLQTLDLIPKLSDVSSRPIAKDVPSTPVVSVGWKLAEPISCKKIQLNIPATQRAGIELLERRMLPPPKLISAGGGSAVAQPVKQPNVHATAPSRTEASGSQQSPNEHKPTGGSLAADSPVTKFSDIQVGPVMERSMSGESLCSLYTTPEQSIYIPSANQDDDAETSSKGQLHAMISTAKDFLNSFLTQPKDGAYLQHDGHIDTLEEKAPTATTKGRNTQRLDKVGEDDGKKQIGKPLMASKSGEKPKIISSGIRIPKTQPVDKKDGSKAHATKLQQPKGQKQSSQAKSEGREQQMKSRPKLDSNRPSKAQGSFESVATKHEPKVPAQPPKQRKSTQPAPAKQEKPCVSKVPDKSEQHLKSTGQKPTVAATTAKNTSLVSQNKAQSAAGISSVKQSRTGKSGTSIAKPGNVKTAPQQKAKQEQKKAGASYKADGTQAAAQELPSSTGRKQEKAAPGAAAVKRMPAMRSMIAIASEFKRKDKDQSRHLTAEHTTIAMPRKARAAIVTTEPLRAIHQKFDIKHEWESANASIEMAKECINRALFREIDLSGKGSNDNSAKLKPGDPAKWKPSDIVLSGAKRTVDEAKSPHSAQEDMAYVDDHRKPRGINHQLAPNNMQPPEKTEGGQRVFQRDLPAVSQVVERTAVPASTPTARRPIETTETHPQRLQPSRLPPRKRVALTTKAAISSETAELPPVMAKQMPLPQKPQIAASRLQRRGSDSQVPPSEVVSPLTKRSIPQPRVDIKKVDEELLNLLSLGQELETEHKDRRRLQHLVPPAAKLSKAQSMILAPTGQREETQESIPDLRDESAMQRLMPGGQHLTENRKFNLLSHQMEPGTVVTAHQCESREQSLFGSRESVYSTQSIPQAPVFAKTMKPKFSALRGAKPSTSMTSLPSSRQSSLEAAAQKIDEIIHGVKHRGSVPYKPSIGEVHQLDAVYESLGHECELLEQQQQQQSTSMRPPSFATKSKESCLPQIPPDPPERGESVERFWQMSHSKSLTPGNYELQQSQDSIPPVGNDDPQKYDFTKKWLQDDLKSLVTDAKPDLLDFGPRPDINDNDDSSVGSASIEVDAILSRPRRSRYAPDLLQHRIEKPKAKQPSPPAAQFLAPGHPINEHASKLSPYAGSLCSVDTGVRRVAQQAAIYQDADNSILPSCQSSENLRSRVRPEDLLAERGHVKKKVTNFERLDRSVSGESSERNSSCGSRRSRSVSDHMSDFIQKFEKPSKASLVSTSDVDGWHPAPVGRSDKPQLLIRHCGSVQSLPAATGADRLGIYHIQRPPKQTIPTKADATPLHKTSANPPELQRSTQLQEPGPWYDPTSGVSGEKLVPSRKNIAERRRSDIGRIPRSNPIDAVDSLVAELELNTEDTENTNVRFPTSSLARLPGTGSVDALCAKGDVRATVRYSRAGPSVRQIGPSQNESYENANTNSGAYAKPAVAPASLAGSRGSITNAGTQLAGASGSKARCPAETRPKPSAFADVFEALDRIAEGDLDEGLLYATKPIPHRSAKSPEIINSPMSPGTSFLHAKSSDRSDTESVLSNTSSRVPRASSVRRSQSDVTAQSTSQVMTQVVAALATLDRVKLPPDIGRSTDSAKHPLQSQQSSGMLPEKLPAIEETSENVHFQNHQSRIPVHLNRRPLSLDFGLGAAAPLSSGRSFHYSTKAKQLIRSQSSNDDYDNLGPPLTMPQKVTKSESRTSVKSEPLSGRHVDPAPQKQARQTIKGLLKKLTGSQDATKLPIPSSAIDGEGSPQSDWHGSLIGRGNSVHCFHNPTSTTDTVKYPAQDGLRQPEGTSSQYSVPSSVQSSLGSAQLEASLEDTSQQGSRVAKSLHNILPPKHSLGSKENAGDKPSRRLRFPWTNQRKQIAK